MRLLAIVLVLSACAARPVPVPPMPLEARTCPQGASLPPVPHKPRTVDQVAAWGNAVARALATTEAARTECARKLWDATGDQDREESRSAVPTK